MIDLTKNLDELLKEIEEIERDFYINRVRVDGNYLIIEVEDEMSGNVRELRYKISDNPNSKFIKLLKRIKELGYSNLKELEGKKVKFKRFKEQIDDVEYFIWLPIK